MDGARIQGAAVWLRLLIVAFLPLPAEAWESRLEGSPSPYLAMHADDPVRWWPWGEAALAAAQEQDKLLFVSIGYFSCHWCHVMHRESFRDAEIARLLNEHFIPVKVDRELDPELDAHLIDFVRRTQGYAGWPLNVFLTPDGHPVTGAAYLPPERFRAVLQKLSGLWRTRRDEVERLARRALDLLVRARRPKAAATVVLDARRLQSKFVARALELADELSGGFGHENKFPMQPQLMALLQADAGAREEAVEAFLRLTLDQMAQRGLRDHLAGGFFRYTVDPQWSVPHYEKMLYTQALLALLYLEAADRLDHSAYRAVAFETLDFTLRKMASPGGGYVAALSAVDEAGVEGGHYLWSRDEVAALFSPEELPWVLRRWRFEGWTQGEEKALPLAGLSTRELARSAGVAETVMSRWVAQWRQRLLDARAERVLPMDGKVLAGWNGLLLTALARAAAAPGGDRFRDPARELARYLIDEHWDGGRLWRTPKEQGVPARLEDYAWVALGLDAWSRVSGEPAQAGLVERLVAESWRLFHHDSNGWRDAERPLLPGMPAAHAQEDGALPAPSAAVLTLSRRVPAHAEKARKVLLAARPAVQSAPFWHPSYLLLLVAP